MSSLLLFLALICRIRLLYDWSFRSYHHITYTCIIIIIIIIIIINNHYHINNNIILIFISLLFSTRFFLSISLTFHPSSSSFYIFLLIVLALILICVIELALSNWQLLILAHIFLIPFVCLSEFLSFLGFYISIISRLSLEIKRQRVSSILKYSCQHFLSPKMYADLKVVTITFIFIVFVNIGLLVSFFTLVVFHWKPSDSKSSQDSRSLLIFLLISIVLWPVGSWFFR